MAAYLAIMIIAGWLQLMVVLYQLVANRVAFSPESFVRGAFLITMGAVAGGLLAAGG